MPAQTVIDSLEFARTAQELRGSIPVARLTRLRDCLSDSHGEVNYAVTGGRDERGRPMLKVDISGSLRLQCQRCLAEFAYPLGLCSPLLLVRPGEDMSANAEDPEAPDCIEASPELDVVALVEDEILLGLPLAPRHPEDACQSAWGAGKRATGAGSAFAKLAALKHPRPKH